MGNPNREIQLFELQERTGELLGSQKQFLYARPENSSQMYATLNGGFCSGKSRVCVVKGLALSAMYPGNEGIIGRFRGKDLEDSVKPLFFEVCPPSWIKRGGYNKSANTVTLRNGSKIYFRHIHDPNARTAKTRRVGANLGWFFLDQMEELDIEHWNAMVGRLRNPKAKIRMGFGSANPNGGDWIQKMFFPNVRPFAPGEFFQVHRRGNIMGIAVNSNENRVSNGGFVSDDFFDSLKDLYPPEWYARYVLCSFEDFSGKIYKGFGKETVHVLRNSLRHDHPMFENWELIVGIDVGGDCPWAVTPAYVDTYGNLIFMDGFYKATGRTREVADWIKVNLPWTSSRTTFVIDPENKVAMIELADMGIHCRIANKAVLPGILKTSGYFHVDEKKKFLPSWFLETQPKEIVEKFNGKGSPGAFVNQTNSVFIEEHDSYVWDANRRNQPLKTATKRWDSCDSSRYITMTRPQRSSLPSTPAYNRPDVELDEVSKREWDRYDKKVALHMSFKNGTNLREAEMDEISSTQEHFAALMDGEGRYDWN